MTLATGEIAEAAADRAGKSCLNLKRHFIDKKSRVEKIKKPN